MSRKSDFLLAAAFVLSLLLLPAAVSWDNYQKQLADQQFIVEAEEEATALTQQFRANCPTETQIHKGILRAQSLLEKATDPFADNGALIKKALLKGLPEKWLADDAIFFACKFSAAGSHALTGEGLERTSSAFLALITNNLRNWHNVGSAEQTKINNRLANMFGERVSGDLLLSNRRGRSIDVIFNGMRRYLIWDFLSISGQQAGAFLIITAKKPLPEDAAAEAMREIAHSGRHKFYPTMIPLESLKSLLKPVVPVEYRSETPVLNFFSLLARNPQHGKIASLSVGMLHENTFLFRSVISRSLPYELWLTTGQTAATHLRISGLYALILFLFWTIIVIIRGWRGQPYNFSVKARLLGLVLFVGGFPILLLVLAGKSAIEQDHHIRYRAMVDSMHAELREIDGNSTALRIIFENISRRYLADTEFKSAAIADTIDYNAEVFRRCFAEFAANGVPVSSIGITKFGKDDRLILPPDSQNRQDGFKLHVFAPMMYAGLKEFSEKNYADALKSLAESRRLGLETYSSMVNSAVFGDVAMARQKGILMSFGDAGHFVIYDFVADNDNVVAAILFFSPAAEAYLRFAKNAIMRGSRATPDRLWAMAVRKDNGVSTTVARERSAHQHENWFLRKLATALNTSSFQVETREDTLAVCAPCEHMQGITVGSTISLVPLFATTRRQYQLLLGAALALFAILVMVTSALLSYFLRPLNVIETGITNILERRFDFRLNLNRDDELGDVADAFDGMAQGLYERSELAQFVSGTLTNQLEAAVQLDRKPEKRWGFVLASDIRNFTTLSETWPPEQIVELLNRHLELMSTQITAHHGEIDKFIGDAVIAVFFADSKEEAAANAVAASRAMMAEHSRLSRERSEDGRFGYAMGIGIAGGELLIGSFGAGERHEYSLTGNARHLSEVLEAESKQGKFTHIVVSQEIRTLLPELSLAPIGNGDNFEVIET